MSWQPVNIELVLREGLTKSREDDEDTCHVLRSDGMKSRRNYITAHRLEFKRVLIDDDDLYNHTKPSQSTAVHEPKGQQETKS